MRSCWRVAFRKTPPRHGQLLRRTSNIMSRRAIITALALLLACGGCQQEGSHPDAGKTPTHDAGKAAAIDDHPLDVQVTQPQRQNLAYTIALPANVAPLYQTTLYAKVSGYLKWIGPDKGDHVKKNQVVAIIDAPEVEEQYQQAAADFKIRKITFDRLRNVWKESPDVIAKQDVDVAEAAFDGARTMMQQRAVLRDYTKVRAPYDGTITARFADPGALIQVATSSATTAIPLFTIMELPDRSFPGVITRSTLALDPSTRSLLVEVDLANPDHALRPGTYAELAINLREIPNALVLPPQAVNSGAKGKSVFVVEQGKARSVPVQTGITDGKWIEITKGLQGEEDVVVVGKRTLLDGSVVQASQFKLPEAKPSQQKFERKSAGLPSSSMTPHAEPPAGLKKD